MQFSKLTKAWFDYPDDPAGSRFEIKHLLSGDLAEIEDEWRNETVSLIRDDSGRLATRGMISIKKKVRNEMTVCAAVSSWENVLDPDGNAIECTRENKLRMCRELPEDEYEKFLSWLNDRRVELKNVADAQQEGALVN